jgi:hypothetical protein
MWPECRPPNILWSHVHVAASLARLRQVRARTPAEIAQDIGSALPTVRTHLSKIFAKTGTARQVHLVRRSHSPVTRRIKEILKMAGTSSATRFVYEAAFVLSCPEKVIMTQRFKGTATEAGQGAAARRSPLLPLPVGLAAARC